VFGLRDIVWACAICGALALFFQLQPQWSARAAIKRDALAGFNEAYAGSRFVSGDLITSNGAAHIDPMRPLVQTRQLEVQAQRIDLTGNKSEIVARHVIYLLGSTEPDGNASQEVHARLERQDGDWVYTLFETRDGQVLSEPNHGNPWARALVARREGPKAPRAAPRAAQIADD